MDDGLRPLLFFLALEDCKTPRAGTSSTLRPIGTSPIQVKFPLLLIQVGSQYPSIAVSSGRQAVSQYQTLEGSFSAVPKPNFASKYEIDLNSTYSFEQLV